IMNAHGAVIWPRNTSECRSIAGRSCIVDVQELPCCFAYILNKLGGLMMTRQRLLLREQRPCDNNTGQQYQDVNGPRVVTIGSCHSSLLFYLSALTYGPCFQIQGYNSRSALTEIRTPLVSESNTGECPVPS